MISTLPIVARDHHERLMRHVDQLPAIGDSIGSASMADLRREVNETATFMSGLLVPHMEAAERTIYPELERLLQNRHSMAPMRREHAAVRRLLSELLHIREQLDREQLSNGDAFALRRILFNLYALLKIHLAEEQLYVAMIEHGISADAGAALAAAMEHAGIAES